MQINEFAEDKTITLQTARDRRLFGPVFHGTSQENWQNIHQQGFSLSANQSNGYTNQPYALGYPPPVHHLGYAIYFTTVRSIGIQYNRGTAKGLKEFYLDVPRIEEINFGAPKTMMQWWLKNGYDGELAKQNEAARIMATNKMTDLLKSKYDAVWFKGKSMYKLLDGDQIAVYDPTRIYFIDNTTVEPMRIGAKVRSRVDRHRNKWDDTTPINTPVGTIGIILDKLPTKDVLARYPAAAGWIRGSEFYYTIKWAKGGTESNVIDADIEPK